MIPTWPASLTVRVQASSYREIRDDQLIISPTELGPAKIRRRRPHALRRRQMTLVLTSNELTDWAQFLDLIAGGVLSFLWQPPFAASKETGRFLIPDGGFILTQSATGAGDTLWTVSVTVETVP